MTQEEKQLLLKDLCARLSYNIKLKIAASDMYIETLEGVSKEGIVRISHNNIFSRILMEHCKPYLRPMSRMTKKEREEYRKFSYYGAVGIRNEDFTDTVAVPSFEKIDYLNSHHFDYRGLIEKGLAIKAPEDMYAFD